MIPDMLTSTPFLRYFDKIDSMVLKHLPKIYKLYKGLNIQQFGQVPPCYKALGNRGFTSWRKIEIGGYYQGEVDHLDRPDGMGVVVQPGTAMVIGYHNEDTELGQGIQITYEGNILIGTWHGHSPWDVDLYHNNALGENMFSQCLTHLRALYVRSHVVRVCVPVQSVAEDARPFVRGNRASHW